MPALGRLGASLLRLHYAFDPQRFIAPRGNPEEGYGWFLGSQLRDADAVVFVAERAGAVVGYVYAGLEPQSWKELREAAGFIHDVLVDEPHRGAGIASRAPRRRQRVVEGARRAACHVVDCRAQPCGAAPLRARPDSAAR